jgi:hypothetical protein
MSIPRARINCAAALQPMIAFVLAGIPAIGSTDSQDEYRDRTSELRRGPGISNHPVRVVPSTDIEIPAGWPLDANGAITCLTCHAVLPAVQGETGPRLRYSDGQQEESTAFCTKCHVGQDRRSAAAMHWAAVGVAHIKPSTGRTTRSAELLDSESRRCLACHDGVNAAESQNMTGWNRASGYIGNRTGNHPVGVRYPSGARRDSGTPMRPPSLLPKEVRLPDGLVSCVSCHDLYAREQHLLTVPLDRSELCLTCHEMD